MPRCRAHIIETKAARIEVDNDMLGLSRLQHDALELFQFPRWAWHSGRCFADIELGDGSSCAFTSIRHVEADREAALARRSSPQVSERKRGVRESKTKRKERLNMSVLITAIGYKHGFPVDDLVGPRIWVVAGETGVVANVLLPADGQMAGRIRLSEEQSAPGSAALFARIPRGEDALNFVFPVRDINATT